MNYFPLFYSEEMMQYYIWVFFISILYILLNIPIFIRLLYSNGSIIIYYIFLLYSQEHIWRYDMVKFNINLYKKNIHRIGRKINNNNNKTIYLNRIILISCIYKFYFKNDCEHSWKLIFLYIIISYFISLWYY